MPFFDFGSVELLLIGIVALIVVGPKDLPKLMRAAGQALAKVRGAARHFKSGVDEMMRQADLDEMQSKWDAHNKSVMTGSSADDAGTARSPAPDIAAGSPSGAPPAAASSSPTTQPTTPTTPPTDTPGKL
ncbi:twin-arginine translocase subunit TatB [Pacificimonas sp. WHA3]|uniref:Twin-arginine translocase subunit TatB n=1 Tax=Pacificimonas pallii TaxID=2827236 RepID=A0ABS6SGE6_9SPHN|nr:Sec-independent protein translocase protein TatB [Pacificimonas pallii]MBV7257470.1 twin-arginine translocase subunit TatB [Pacificimonas pallii]